MNTSLKTILRFPLTKIFLSIGLCFSLFIIVQNFVLKPLLYSFIIDKNIANPIIHCISMLVLLISYYFLFRILDDREINELSLNELPKEMFGGFIWGFFTISIPIGVLYLLGYYKIISFSLDNYTLSLFTKLLLAALIEELFHRGLVFREVEKWLGTHIGILVVMLIETWHILNPNATFYGLFLYLCWGFTMSMIFVYTKRIWLPFFFHVGWNFAQPFYGSNLTGLNDMGTIINSKFEGPILLTGGEVGIEDSIITTILLLSISVYLYYLSRKE
ncbi:MAG: CPBP family intramembrane metalloprotease [Chitinophagaceae bacterium]|jgi:membrane protease YdiL (CAAX protease family)|nr:CPBP family intramembrane metalloprotease [Chitinophagaceae bacterium]